MSRFDFCIVFLLLKLIIIKSKAESNVKFLSGMQLLYPKEEHLCGGVLISVWYVLTAASCIEGFEVGWDLSQLTLSTADGSQIRKALTFSIHGSYKQESLENNLAVIKTNKSFNPGDNVQPIAILENNTTKDCFVVTWSIKEKFITFEQPIEKCPLDISKTMCMGGDWNVNVCQEDYGCPLVCESLLAGIFIGPGHACDGLPGVYVDIKAYKDWLWDSTENFSSQIRLAPPIAIDTAAVHLCTMKFQFVCVIYVMIKCLENIKTCL